MDPSLLLLAHAAATWFMVGVIWFVQVVHYPLFGQVGSREFAGWQAANVRRTTFVVGPAMGVEAASALGLPFVLPGWIPWSGLGLLALCWASTAFLQVPCHARLERSFDPATGHRLVTSNWVRTVAWTARGLLATELLRRGLG